MRAELERRGVASEIAGEAVAAAFPEGEEAAARRAAERWLGGGRSDPRALARHLDRKGFSQGAILGLVEELEPLDDGDRD